MKTVRFVLMCGVLGAMAFGQSAAAQDKDQTTFYDENGLKLRWHFQAGAYFGGESNIFWDLGAATGAGAGFDPDTVWQEFFIKPGISFEYMLDNSALFYGKLSAVSSYTAGTDPFDEGDNGDTTIEEAYLAVRGGSEQLSYDVSVGAREFRLGTGMLIATGATSGFERGALKFGPRKAWERSVTAEVSSNGITGSVFFLDPNELPSTNGDNELAGFDLRYDGENGRYLGATYVDVLNSGSPYPQAAPGGIGAPTVITGAREGTETLAVYGGTGGLSGALENWSFTADVALQRNDTVDLEAWAGRVQASYEFDDVTWSPRVTLGYQTFSGDDPDTPELERFDPLYYEGSPAAWATGTKSASTFINSNVNALSLAMQGRPSPRETVTLRYAHIRANELNSPIQFGQATRVDTTGGGANVVSGVSDAHLADDLFLEYFRIINPNAFLTVGLAVSYPGSGIKDIVGSDADPWTGAFINVVINF
ncbi:MAG: alginate export family protein [Pseudomonadota bacterium]